MNTFVRRTRYVRLADIDPDRAVAGYFDIANRQAGRLDRLRYSDDFGGFNAPISSAHANTHG
jgi:hypothetical protein